MNLPCDRIDRKLLAALDRDSRQSFSRIAKQLRLGSDLIEYRVDRYLRQGFIGRFSAVIDPLAAGWWVIKNYVKLQLSSKKTEGLISFLEQHPRLYWLAELHGRFDLLFSLCVRDPAEGREFQDMFEDRFGGIVIEQQVCFLASVQRFSKKYLGFGKPQEYSFSGAKRQGVVKPEDARLLNILAADARCSTADLARRCGISQATLKQRIEQLEELQVILGYRFQFDYEKVGIMLFKLLVHCSDQRSSFADQLQNFCREHPNVTCYIRQMGMFPTEIEVEVDGYPMMNAFIEEFRRRFDSGVSTAEVILIKRDRFHRFPETIPRR
jgi:DNA-binding Lrp family transcriptional regulator